MDTVWNKQERMNSLRNIYNDELTEGIEYAKFINAKVTLLVKR